MLNKVSRRRSDVGRVPSDGGLLSFRPRNLPAMMRNEINGRYVNGGSRALKLTPFVWFVKLAERATKSGPGTFNLCHPDLQIALS